MPSLRRTNPLSNKIVTAKLKTFQTILLDSSPSPCYSQTSTKGRLPTCQPLWTAGCHGCISNRNTQLFPAVDSTRFQRDTSMSVMIEDVKRVQAPWCRSMAEWIAQRRSGLQQLQSEICKLFTRDCFSLIICLSVNSPACMHHRPISSFMWNQAP